MKTKKINLQKLIPFLAGAIIRSGCPTEGLVPCGTVTCPCQLCDFFVMFDRIVDFVLFSIVPPIAVLMLVISGMMFFLAKGDPSALNKAKAVLTATLMGLAIIFSAFLFINLFFNLIGVNEWTGLQEWFKYPCP